MKSRKTSNGLFRKYICAALIFIGAGAIPAPPGALAHDPNPAYTLQDMTILTDEDIVLGGKFDVLEGNVCSRNGDIILGGRGTVRIPKGAPADTNSDVIAATGRVILKNFARVGHTRGTVVKNGTTGVATHLQDSAMSCPDNPPFPSFSHSSDPAADITCTSSGIDIVPGTYRDLIVTFKGKCNFKGPGDYNFRRVVADTNSSYSFNFLDPPEQCSPKQPYNLNVKEFMYLGEFGNFNAPLSHSMDSTNSVVVNIEGTDGSYGGDNPAPHGEVFDYRGDGGFIACRVFAKNGTIGLRGLAKHKDHSEFHAQWIGKAFRQDDQILTVAVAQTLDPECCTPGKDCACILDFHNLLDQTKAAKAGDKLQILGKGLKSDTVSKVLFFPTSSVIDLADPEASATCSVPSSDPGFTFVNDGAIELTVPPACGAGTYRLGIINGGFCIDRTLELTITP